jgi:hypothetical protein
MHPDDAQTQKALTELKGELAKPSAPAPRR